MRTCHRVSYQGGPQVLAFLEHRSGTSSSSFRYCVRMTRYRLSPSPAQEEILRDHCRHARFVWNLAVEQQSWWRPGRRSAPGFAEHCRQLTHARAEHDWLAAGSVVVQQQALRDFSQAMANYFAGT